jgi:L,D-transpeptidase ErfK/SrfK
MRLNKTGMTIIVFNISLLFSSLTYAKSHGAQLCQQEGFECMHIKKGQSWKKLFPDEEIRDKVMRINRLNIQLYPGMIIAVPKDPNADLMAFSPFPTKIEPTGEKEVVIDPRTNAWGAYDNQGNLIKWGPASGGAHWCRDIGKSCKTTPGSFRIYTLGSSSCISHKFPLPNGGAPMPYCMFFNGGQALHGEPNGLPGYNASHGCVRMYVNDAEWLRYDFVEGPNSQNKYKGTRITVKEYQKVEKNI